MEMKHIVVGTDLSTHSVVLYAQAIRLAKALGAKVTLVHIDTASAWLLATLDALRSHSEKIQHLCAGRLEADCDRLREHGVDADFTLATARRPSTSLLATCRELGADLLVVGKRGANQQAPLFGSSSHRIMRHAELPVLVVDSGDEELTIPAPVERIITGTDFSEESKRGTHAALALAARLKAQVLLCHVANEGAHRLAEMDWLPDLPARVTETLREATRETFVGFADNLPVKVSTRVDNASNAADVIGTLPSEPGDLLVLPSHGDGADDRILLGSIAERAIRVCTSPVLLLPRAYLALWFKDGWE